jgi:steroid 5-alpha reductase family enzyme
MAQVFTGSAAITAGIQLTGFVAASALKTEVFYDVLGGLNFLALTLYATVFSEGWTADARRVAVSLTFVCSRAWLLCFLAWRAHERGGDSRFDSVLRAETGVNYLRFLVFWAAQGVWVFSISSPMLFINSSAVSSPLSSADLALLGGFAFGVAIEVVADVQKAMWVRAGREGGFCTVGVWSLSRHPNYFGEICQWVCLWLLAYSSSSGLHDAMWWATALSPGFTLQILLNTPETGVAQANGKGLKRYYDSPHAEAYKKYRASTSILVPFVGYSHVPLWLKRTVFLDLQRYEYQPRSGGKGD